MRAAMRAAGVSQQDVAAALDGDGSRCSRSRVDAKLDPLRASFTLPDLMRLRERLPKLFAAVVAEMTK